MTFDFTAAFEIAAAAWLALSFVSYTARRLSTPTAPALVAPEPEPVAEVPSPEHRRPAQAAEIADRMAVLTIPVEAVGAEGNYLESPLDPADLFAEVESQPEEHWEVGVCYDGLTVAQLRKIGQQYRLKGARAAKRGRLLAQLPTTREGCLACLA